MWLTQCIVLVFNAASYFCPTGAAATRWVVSAIPSGLCHAPPNSLMIDFRYAVWCSLYWVRVIVYQISFCRLNPICNTISSKPGKPSFGNGQCNKLSEASTQRRWPQTRINQDMLPHTISYFCAKVAMFKFEYRPTYTLHSHNASLNVPPSCSTSRISFRRKLADTPKVLSKYMIRPRRVGANTRP